MGDVYNIHDNVADNGATLVHIGNTTNYNSSQSVDSNILEELHKIQLNLEQTEPMIAKTLGELSAALKKRNQPQIQDLVKQLSSKVTVAFLADAVTEAGKVALRSLGIPL